MNSLSQSVFPAWGALIQDDELCGEWRNGKFWYPAARRLAPDSAPPRQSRIAAWVVQRFYASHKRSAAIDRALNGLLNGLQANDWGLNVGAGGSNLHPRVINLDIVNSEATHVIVEDQKLPFKDSSLALVISQEVFEHLAAPEKTVAEALRILRPGGTLFFNVPFMIGYHPGPTDFWRFTREGVAQMLAGEDWEIEEIGLSVGHGTGFYRIAVEFAAVTASCLIPRAYMAAKGLAAILLSPLQWLDALTARSPEANRIPGGYYCVARKRMRADGAHDLPQEAITRSGANAPAARTGGAA